MKETMNKREFVITAAMVCALSSFPLAAGAADAAAKGVSAPTAAGPDRPETNKVELKKHFPTKQLEKAEDVKWTHAPYNVGKCGLCHESDDREKPGPMRAPVNTICLSCHKKEKIHLKRHTDIHEPVEKDCGYCHNAHNSKNRALLYQPMEKLCVACHVAQGKELAAKTQHEPVIKQKKCETCHDSHATNHKKLLRTTEAELCLDCHGGRKTQLKDEKGRKLADIKALESRKVKHEPFEKGNCSDCHNPHGSPYVRLLSGSNPSEFYASYQDEKYALCYSCHNKSRVNTEKIGSLTGFRDGSKNLHYAHVVKPSNGRACRVCHDDHATDNPHLIRSSVPYGPSGWELPIVYTEASNGGKCAKTCHEEKTYNNGGKRPNDIAAAYKKRKIAEVAEAKGTKR